VPDTDRQIHLLAKPIIPKHIKRKDDDNITTFQKYFDTFLLFEIIYMKQIHQ